MTLIISEPTHQKAYSTQVQNTMLFFGDKMIHQKNKV